MYLINLPIHMTMVVTLMLLIHPLRETLTMISPLPTASQKICGALKATPWVNQATPVGEQNAKNNAVLDTQFNGVGYKVTGAQPIKQGTFGWGSFNYRNIDGMPSKIRGLTAVMRTASFTLSPVPRHVL